SEQREYETIESDIERIEKEISDVEAAVLEHSSDFEMLRELGERKEMLDNELMEKMDRWEYLNELAVRIERGEMVEV
ncbi:MAG: ABC transporter C-terminal domain-containing protein, partial [Anaerovoracaceae bacterium]